MKININKKILEENKELIFSLFSVIFFCGAFYLLALFFLTKEEIEKMQYFSRVEIFYYSFNAVVNGLLTLASDSYFLNTYIVDFLITRPNGIEYQEAPILSLMFHFFIFALGLSFLIFGLSTSNNFLIFIGIVLFAPFLIILAVIMVTIASIGSYIFEYIKNRHSRQKS